MQSQPSSHKKHIKVTDKEAKALRNSLELFNHNFEKEKNEFQTSKETNYYLVSAEYLRQWVEFCESSSEERVEPDAMNQNLLDAGGQLRMGLAEGADFEIVSEKIFKIIELGPGIVMKRKTIIINGEKKVPIYLSTVKYVKLRHKDFSNIEHSRPEVKEITMKATQISFQDTIESLINQIKDSESILSRNTVKLWKNDKSLTVENIIKYLKDKLKHHTMSKKIDGLGRLIDNKDLVIDNLELADGDYFIVEVSDDYGSSFFKSDDEEKCEGCYKFKKLPFPCGCKKVAYCTEECRVKDKRFHIKDCSYAEEQELNETIDMIITKESSQGRVGLQNLGNTCFMNSCLQCLSNCVPLTDYFLKKYFEKEINKDNPLGSKGKLAKNYAKFIKNMWCESLNTFSPHNLKAAVAKINPIFTGYSQHDSQEFFSFLVDGIHEDLNRIVKKPYVESVDSKGRPDEEVAFESWIAHTQRNQSIIVDLMTGQYKSKVICPQCNLESITFDPFTTISLPIPEEARNCQLKYFVIFNNNKKEALQMNFQYTKADSKVWLEKATKLLNREPTDFAFYVLTAAENVYGFESTSEKEIIHKNEVEGKHIFLLELSEEDKCLKERTEIIVKFAKPTYHEGEYDNLWFKRPFYFEKNEATVLDIYKRLLGYLQSIEVGKSKNSEEYYAKMLHNRPFKLVIKFKKTISRSYNRIETSFSEEYVLNDEEKLNEIFSKINLQDCEFDARFTKDSAKLFSFDKLKQYSDKLEKFEKQHKSEVKVSLTECFNLFEEKEKLEKGNEWYCPRCKDHRLATKEMTIYKAPEILILHLKRFKNKGNIRKEKNETNVEFPMVLDLKQYVIDPSPMSTYIPELRRLDKYVEAPFPKSENDSNLPPEYELFAISNHYGGLGGGHYTAYGKNRGSWFEFNDSSVRSASEGSIKGSGAYMLFYRRMNGDIK